MWTGRLSEEGPASRSLAGGWHSRGSLRFLRPPHRAGWGREFGRILHHGWPPKGKIHALRHMGRPPLAGRCGAPRRAREGFFLSLLSPIPAGGFIRASAQGRAGAGGFEPPVRDPKSRALPLGHAPALAAVAAYCARIAKARARGEPFRVGSPSPSPTDRSGAPFRARTRRGRRPPSADGSRC